MNTSLRWQGVQIKNWSRKSFLDLVLLMSLMVSRSKVWMPVWWYQFCTLESNSRSDHHCSAAANLNWTVKCYWFWKKTRRRRNVIFKTCILFSSFLSFGDVHSRLCQYFCRDAILKPCPCKNVREIFPNIYINSLFYRSK